MRLNAEVLHLNLQEDLLSAGWNLETGYPGETPRSKVCASLYNSLIAKFHNEEVDDERNQKALALFLECNDRCRNFCRIEPSRMDEEYVIGEMKALLWHFFNPRPKDEDSHPFLLNSIDIAKCLRWGGGNAVETKGTDFYSKAVTSSMATTSDLLAKYFQRDLSVRSERWAYVEAYRSTARGYKMVRGSRLSFVPKKRSISRTTCKEPPLNMLYQLGIGRLIERQLKRVFGIDFSMQPAKNRRLARIGSQTGEFGTIDLSSASDTISMALVRELVPPESFKWLELTRSPYTILPDGRAVELHMISSMGNGFTFPLQTTIFACLVAAAYRVYNIKLCKPNLATDGNFAVFGDDIIVHRDVYDVVVRCLGILGFTVNRDKSFNEGLFRESCGEDFWSGHNVRGVYIQKLLHDGDVYSAINRLNRWSAYHGILLPRTVGYLRHGCRFLGVPYDEADDAGIKIPLEAAKHARRNIHGAYRYLALCNIPLRAKLPVVDADGVVDPKDIAKVRKLLPHFEYIPDGLLLSVIAGYIRDGAIGLRKDRTRTVLRRRNCPGWDRYPSETAEQRSYGERWKMFTSANLSVG